MILTKTASERKESAQKEETRSAALSTSGCSWNIPFMRAIRKSLSAKYWILRSWLNLHVIVQGVLYGINNTLEQLFQELRPEDKKCPAVNRDQGFFTLVL